MNHDNIEKYFLSLAGEYRVASELLKRNLNATVTFGHAKSADVIAYSSNRKAVVIEVKTSQEKNIPTLFYNKYATPQQEHPDFWVLVQIIVDESHNFKDRFFILSHLELSKVQAKCNRAYRLRRGDIHKGQRVSWQMHHLLTTEARGFDKVPVVDIEKYENQWDKIMNACIHEE